MLHLESKLSFWFFSRTNLFFWSKGIHKIFPVFLFPPHNVEILTNVKCWYKIKSHTFENIIQLPWVIMFIILQKTTCLLVLKNISGPHGMLPHTGTLMSSVLHKKIFTKTLMVKKFRRSVNILPHPSLHIALNLFQQLPNVQFH